MKRGYHVGKTETWNSFSHTRKDLFNVFDGIAVSISEQGILGFQTTTKENISSRRNKALQEPALLVWLHAGGRFEIHGWFKEKGSRHWSVKVENITIADTECGLTMIKENNG
jgi:hypothetical protein